MKFHLRISNVVDESTSDDSTSGEESVAEAVTEAEIKTVDSLDNSNTRHKAYSVLQWEEKIKEHPWLFSVNDRLGCSICKTLKSGKVKNVWRECLVVVQGNTISEQMKSIRKKISQHKNSESHVNAVQNSIKAKKSILPKLVDQLHSDQADSTIRIFRTAYSIAKNNRPFLDHPKLVLLQKLNEIDLGVCTLGE